MTTMYVIRDTVTEKDGTVQMTGAQARAWLREVHAMLGTWVKGRYEMVEVSA